MNKNHHINTYFSFAISNSKFKQLSEGKIIKVARIFVSELNKDDKVHVQCGNANVAFADLNKDDKVHVQCGNANVAFANISNISNKFYYLRIWTQKNEK